MSRYLCEICGTEFDAPYVRKTAEYLDGFPHVYREELCPVCGEAYFKPVEEPL